MKIIGIYKIENIVTKKIYIGFTTNYIKRCEQHRRVWKKGTCGNKDIYNDYLLHGKSSFKFTIIDNCQKDELEKKEIYWIQYFDSTNPLIGYNKHLGGSCGKLSHYHIKSKIPKKVYIKKTAEEIIPYANRDISRQGVLLEDIVTGTKVEFRSIKEMIKTLNLVQSKVYNCLNNPYKKYKHRGYYMKKI